MRTPARSPDDADVIRARLRLLLAEQPRSGWVPGNDLPGSVPDPDDHPGDDRDDLDDHQPDDHQPDDHQPDDHQPDDHEHGDHGPADGGRTGTGPADPTGGGRHRAPGRTARIDPGRPGARAVWAAAAAAVVLLLIWTWLDRPATEPVPAGGPTPSPTAAGTPTPAAPVGGAAGTSGTVVVSVVGQVRRPGLVTLPEGARIADAVDAAGGLLPRADPAAVNLAAVVADGQQVAVGVPGAAGAAPAAAAGAPDGSGPVDLNAATAAELDGLPGIGPVLAERIVDHREQHGPFGRVEDLQDVTGIGPATLEELAGSVTV